MPVGYEVSAMKASFSLSSLEPSGVPLDTPEHARLRTEKPYNSLTKKPRRALDSETENWRRSWGGRDSEDSFLEALLPSYTFLMENNLIDTCKEADGELCMDHKWQLLEEVTREGKVSASQVETLCQEAVEKDICCLRRWIRGMDKRLSPLDLKTCFESRELEDKATEIQCLAVEIQAQGKVIGSLIRHCECLVAASAPENQEEYQQQNNSQQEEELKVLEKEQVEEDLEVEEEKENHPTTPFQEEAAALPQHHRRKHPSKGNANESLKVARCLEKKWHRLYLRALEWQCYIEALLSGNDPKFRRREGRNTNGDTQSLDSGPEHFSSSEAEEVDTCSGEEEEEQHHRGGEEGAEKVEEVKISGGARRVGGGEDGGPRPKQPRLGAELRAEEEAEDRRVGGADPSEDDPLHGMECADSVLKGEEFPTPQFPPVIHMSPNQAVPRNKMKESPHMERMELSQNCAYFVVRRIDTDSEAEAKENGVKTEEIRVDESSSGCEGVMSREKSTKETEIAMSQDTEEEGDEEDDEWVFSRTTAKVPAVDKDVKAKKSLQYGAQDLKDNAREKSTGKVEPMSNGRVFEPLKLNASKSKEKNARIEHWLSQGGPAGEESAESQEEQASKKYPLDSCDASGEYTTSGESSEVESLSSGELDGSVATCRKSSAVAAIALTTAGWNSKVSPLTAQELGISSLPFTPSDGDITPVAEARALPGSSGINTSPSGKTVLRNKRRKGKLSVNHQQSPKSEQKRRPWSICVSGTNQLVGMASGVSGIHPSPNQENSYSASPISKSPHHAHICNARSTSESAIHNLAYSSSSCSTGLDELGSTPGRVGTGSDGFTPTRCSADGEGIGSGAGSAGTGSLRRKKIRNRRKTLGQRSDSGNSDSMPGESSCLMRRGSRSSSKGKSQGSKGSFSQSTSSDYSSSNVVTDETKDEVDGFCKTWKRSGMSDVPPPEEEEEDYEGEGEKLGSLQTEETSSHSEEAWDNYQACHSEGGEYSSDEDKQVAEQFLMRIIHFGDDYRNHFDSQSDGGSSLARQPPTPCSTLDSFPGDGVHSLPRSHSPTPPSPSMSRTGSMRRRKQMPMACSGMSRIRQSYETTHFSRNHQFPLTSQGPPSLNPIINLVDDVGCFNPISVLDSDSDLEEVNHLLRESKSQVLYTEGVLDRALSGGLSPLTSPGAYPPPADYAEIAATCRENIKCVSTLLKSIDGLEDEEEEMILSARDLWETRDLLHRWEMLQARAEECQMVRELRQEIAALRDAMVAPSSEGMRNEKVEDLKHRNELDGRIQEVKAEIAALLDLKSELLNVNVSVNRFLTGATVPSQCMSDRTLVPNTQRRSPSPVDQPDASAKDRSAFSFLKDEVADLYREWDESHERLNVELAALQRASRTWAELEDGLTSLVSTLDSDRKDLTNLTSAVAAARSRKSMSQNTHMTGDTVPQSPALLAASVRELARVLTEERGSTGKRMVTRGDSLEEYDEWETNIYVDGTDFNGSVHTSSMNSADPLGSLSDSGISDSGSEGLGMGERGRRLAALRKLARVLAATLGPNSPPLVALKQRMDDTQRELRNLQKTCRDLIVCTAMLGSACHGRGGIIEESMSEDAGSIISSNGVVTPDSTNVSPSLEEEKLQRLKISHEGKNISNGKTSSKKFRNGRGGGDDDDDDDFDFPGKGRGKGHRHWLWRALCCAMPFQLAIVLLLYAAYFLEPHCCSAINNMSFSLSPQLHYVRGPPPT